MKSYQQFFAELKRRHVFRVAAAYGVVGFIVLQLADILVPALELPESVTRAVALLLVLAFPVAILLAWAFEMTPDGVRRTDAAEAEEVERIVAAPASARWPIGLAAVAATILLGLGSFWVLGDRPDGPGAASGDAGSLDAEVLVVLPFAVSGAEETEYLGEGIVSLLTTKMDGAGGLRAVDSRSLLRAASQQEYTPGDDGAAASLASFFGAGLFLTGEIVEAAGRMQVSANLRRTGGEGLAAVTVDGDADEVFELVDHLTAELLSKLSGGPAARVQRIAAVTTSSVPALKEFLLGEQQFRAGQFRNSMESFERAIEQDSLFALAYYRFSLAAEWSLAHQRSVEAANRAVELSDRLAERDRRILEAYRTRRLGRNQQAAVLYRSILGTYPDEMEALLDLGEIEFHSNPLHGRAFVESRATLEKVLALDPEHATALIHMARVAAYTGDAVAVDTLAGRFLALGAEPGRVLEVATLRAGVGDSTSVAAFGQQLESATEAGLSLATWSASVYARNLPLARASSEALAAPGRSPESRRLGYAYLAHLAASEEDWPAVESALESLTALSRGNGLEHRALIALLPFREPSRPEFRRLQAELAALDPAAIETSDNPNIGFTAHDPLHPLVRYYLLGLLSAGLEQWERAGAYADSLAGIVMGPAYGSLAGDLSLAVRAEIDRLRGNDEEALRALEAQNRHLSYVQTFASPLLSNVRERWLQAELLARLGRRDEARQYLETMDQLSTYDLPYREPAAARLAQLEGS